jgi:hypothetical protein
MEMDGGLMRLAMSRMPSVVRSLFLTRPPCAIHFTHPTTDCLQSFTRGRALFPFSPTRPGRAGTRPFPRTMARRMFEDPFQSSFQARSFFLIRSSLGQPKRANLHPPPSARRDAPCPSRSTALKRVPSKLARLAPKEVDGRRVRLAMGAGSGRCVRASDGETQCSKVRFRCSFQARSLVDSL